MLLLPNIKTARRSMKHKLFGYMTALAALLVVALCMGLLVLGRLNSPKEDMAKALNLQLKVFRDDMESMWKNNATLAEHLSGDMTVMLENCLEQRDVSFGELTGDRDSIVAIQEAMLERLCQYTRQSDASGAFVMLNAVISPDGADTMNSGLYVQKSNVQYFTGDMLLYRGVANVGKRQGVMPHRKWAQEFDREQFAELTRHLEKAAAPIAENCRLTEVLELPGTSERAMLLTMPMVGADGTVYGLCGFSVNETYFVTHHEQPSNLARLVCCLTGSTSKAQKADDMLVCYSGDDYCYVPTGRMLSQTEKDGLLHFIGEEFSFVGLAMPLDLAKGDADNHTVAVMIPKEDYDSVVLKSTLGDIVLTALLLFFATVCCLFFSRKYVAPILKDLERLKQQDRGGEDIAFNELKNVSSVLQKQDEQHKQRVSTLEGEKQEVTSQLEQAKADAKQLAYSRKTEIDPAVYQRFLRGINSLTEREEQLFRLYADGMGIQEVRKCLDMKQDAIKFHNTNIRSKLGLSAIKEIARYAAVMRQGEEVLPPAEEEEPAEECPNE